MASPWNGLAIERAVKACAGDLVWELEPGEPFSVFSLTSHRQESSRKPVPSLSGVSVTTAGKVLYSLERHGDSIMEGEEARLHYDLLRVLAVHLKDTLDPMCPGHDAQSYTDVIVHGGADSTLWIVNTNGSGLRAIEVPAHQKFNDVGGLCGGAGAHPALRHFGRNPKTPVLIRISPRDSLSELRPFFRGPEDWLNREICKYRYSEVLSVIEEKNSTRYRLRFHQYCINQEGLDEDDMVWSCCDELTKR